MYQLSLDVLQQLRQEIANQLLEMPWQYERMSLTDLQKIANGIGPDKWPSLGHEVADDALATFVVDSVGHDIRYEFGLGTMEDWHDANRQFLANCRRTVAYLHKGEFIEAAHRAVLDGVAELLFLAVETPEGWASYMAAHARGPAVVVTP